MVGGRLLKGILAWMRMRMSMSMGRLLSVRKALEHRSLGLMADRRDHHLHLSPHCYLLLDLLTQSLHQSCHSASMDPHPQLQQQQQHPRAMYLMINYPRSLRLPLLELQWATESEETRSSVLAQNLERTRNLVGVGLQGAVASIVRV